MKKQRITVTITFDMPVDAGGFFPAKQILDALHFVVADQPDPRMMPYARYLTGMGYLSEPEPSSWVIEW